MQHIMQCYLFNARSLLNKLPELHYVLYSGNIDFVCVTESWLTEDITDGLLDPRCMYTVVKCNRSHSKGGGVCVLIKRHFKVAKVELSYACIGSEIVCFDLLDPCVTYRFFVVCRPPAPHNSLKDNLSKSQIMEQLVTCLEINANKIGPNIILGDFNCLDIDWQAMLCSTDLCHKILYDFAVFNGFTQCVSSPTRLSKVLDLVFVDDPLIISSVDIVPPFSTSDHNAISCEILYSKSSQLENPSHNKQFMWKHGDYDGLCNYLACYNWNDFFTYNLTADSLWQTFRDILDCGLELFVPYKFVCCESTPSRKYPRRIRELIARKRCLWRHQKRDPNNEVIAVSYKNITKECKMAIHDFELRIEKKLIDAANSGQFFKYVNKKLGRSHSTGILKTVMAKT